MRRTKLVVLLCFLSFLVSAQRSFIITGYVANYSFSKFDLAALQYLDRVYYFSASPDESGRFFFPDEDLNRLTLVRSKLNKAQQLYLVIGGWLQSKNIPLMAKSGSSRSDYIEKLVTFCKEQGINGVDLDWEDYPAVVDRGDYVLLVKELSKALHKNGLSFSVALGISDKKIRLAVEIQDLVDEINVMSYGKFDKEGNQAPGDLFEKWLKDYQDAGIRMEKLIIGVPFYGKRLPDQADHSPIAMSYADIEALTHPASSMNSYGKYGYNGIDLIKWKTGYLLQNGYRGIMIWELSQDLPASSDSSLLQTIYRVRGSQDDLDLHALLPDEIDSSQIFISGTWYHWCSSVIQGEDGKYYMFYSRWPHGTRALDDDSMNYIFNGFKGWLKYSEIACAVSERPCGPYHYLKTILKGSGRAGDWDRFTMHNPQIRKFGRSYYLYYISNSYDSTITAPKKDWQQWLRYNCTQKIGVIKASSLARLIEGKYEKPALPIMEPDGVHTFEVTTNPSVTQGPDGRYYMIYKSRKPHVGNMTLWMAVSDRPDGQFKEIAEVFTTPEMACEDPCLWYDGRRKLFYAAVKYYSNSKLLAPQFGALALITSTDGLHWKPAAHSLISLREIRFTGHPGTTLAHLERPFVLRDKEGQPQALFAAAAIEEPGKADASAVDFEHNSFIVCFKLKTQ